MKVLSANDLETDESRQLDQDYEQPSYGIQHYGNIKMLHKGKIHISVGPDCNKHPNVGIFSIIAMGFLCAASYGLYKIKVFLNFDTLGNIINFFFVFLPPVTFLITLFKNPGIYNP